MTKKISLRQQQKKRSREKNNITTMQLSLGNKVRLKAIVENAKFQSLDEALDEVLTHYEESQMKEHIHEGYVE